MSEIFASATVRINPDLSGFTKNLNELLDARMKNIKPRKVKIAPALTANFVGSLRQQVNEAIAQAQKGIKPIRIAAIVTTPTGGGVVDVVGRGPAGGAGGGATKIESETVKAINARKLLADATKQLEGIEDKATLATTRGAQARVRFREATKVLPRLEEALALSLKTSDKALQTTIGSMVQRVKVGKEAFKVAVAQADAEKKVGVVSGAGRTAPTGLSRVAQAAGRESVDLLRRTQSELARVDEKAIGKKTELAAATARLTQATKADTLAEQLQGAARRRNSPVMTAAADQMRRLTSARVADEQRAQTLADNEAKRAAATQKADAARAASAQKTATARSAALRRETAAANAAANASARSQAQLSRGGQASLLSLAGIRGATLAASRSFLVGAAAITVFAKAVKSFADLERNLHVFEATLSATAEEMVAVRDEARALGADLSLPGVSAGDAAGAMVELAKAGLSVQDSIAGARGVLQLSTAAAIDNAQAVQLVANALNAFQLSGRDAVVIADTFANAANLAQGSIADVGTAFQQAAAAGRQVGLSFQDTSLFLTELAQNGLRGSDAGTSLRTALIRLINPSKAAKAEFNKLGIEIRDASGNLRPDVFIQIAEAMKDLTPAQRDANIALIGGQDAFRAITILGRQSIGQFIAMRKALREEGTAAEIAAARTEGLHGAMDGLASVLETVGTDAASKVGPGLSVFVRNVASGITAMAESEQVAETLGDALDTVGRSFSLVGSAAKAMAGPVFFAANSLQQVVSAIGVTEILSAVVAFKLLGRAVESPKLGRLQVQASLAKLEMRALAAASLAAGAPIGRLGLAGKTASLAIRTLATSLPVAGLAVAGLTAGLIFLITRESQAARATRHLAEASKELVSALGAADQASRTAFLSANSVNAAQGEVFAAAEAANAARSALAVSDAKEGSFSRRKLALALAIAIDNLAIAEQRLAEARRTAATDAEIAAQQNENRKTAVKAETDAIKENIAASRRVLSMRGGRNPGDAARTELFSRRSVIAVLQDQAEANRKLATAESIDLAKRQDALANFINELKRMPTDLEIDIIFDPQNTLQESASKIAALLGRSGDEGSRAFLATFLRGTQILGPKLTAEIKAALGAQTPHFNNSAAAHGQAYANTLVDSAKSVLAARFGEIITAAQRSAARASTRQDVAAGSGVGLSGLLSIARDELAARERELDAAAKLLGQGESPSRRTAFEEAAANRRAAFENVRNLQDQINSEQQAAADKIKSDREQASDDFLDALGLGRDAAQERVRAAQATAFLGDDITSNKKFIRLINQQIAIIKAKIKAGKVLAEAGLAAIRELRADRAALVREIKGLQKQRDDARQERIAERISLDIEFAQITENRALEVKARKREIARLKKLQADTKAGTIEYKRLRNLIAEQRKAIADITTENKKLFAELSFNFLTTQQGFAANLLGNLLPLGAIGGTVAGNLATRGGNTTAATASPAAAGGFNTPGGGFDFLKQAREEGGRPNLGGSRIAAFAATAGAGVIAAPTRGQAATTNQLLNQILQVLRHSDAGTRHPSSKQKEKAGKASHDTQG